MLVLYDETGTQKVLRTHGNSLTVWSFNKVPQTSVPVVAAMSIEGILDVKIGQGTNNFKFFETKIAAT